MKIPSTVQFSHTTFKAALGAQRYFYLQMQLLGNLLTFASADGPQPSVRAVLPLQPGGVLLELDARLGGVVVRHGEAAVVGDAPAGGGRHDGAHAGGVLAVAARRLLRVHPPVVAVAVCSSTKGQKVSIQKWPRTKPFGLKNYRAASQKEVPGTERVVLKSKRKKKEFRLQRRVAEISKTDFDASRLTVELVRLGKALGRVHRRQPHPQVRAVGLGGGKVLDGTGDEPEDQKKPLNLYEEKLA